jgi:hypothetical protein
MVEFGAYSAQSITSIGDTLAIEYVIENDSYSLDCEFSYGYGDNTHRESGSGSYTDMSGQYSLILPLDGPGLMGLHTLLRDTLSLSYKGSLGTYQSKQKSTDGIADISMTQAMSDYNAALSLGHSGLDIETLTGPIVFDLFMNVVGIEIGFSMQAAQIETGLAFPLLKSDSPQDVKYLISMQGITFNPELWQSIDSKGLLDRAPINLRLDMGGTVDLLVDLPDIATLGAIQNASDIVQLNSLNLKSLLLSAMGSELTGTGAFTFDQSDTETYDGIPRPDGSLEVRLKRGHALLDQLIAAELITKEQLSGIRMLMRLYGLPGNGVDTLISKIEMTPDGQITANGQRLK